MVTAPITSRLPQQGSSNRLSRCLGAAGSISVQRALNQANSNLAAIKDDATQVIDQAIARLGRLRTAPAELPPPNVLASLHKDGNLIFGLAETFGLANLGLAAGLFCEFLDLCAAKHHWDVDRILIHLDALTCLRHAAEGPDASQVIDALRGLAAHSAARHGWDGAAHPAPQAELSNSTERPAKRPLSPGPG